ncbi:hypothetical protein GQF61_13880 [Sphingobacterium sp. DK4209]|uniref:Uncharacterized protein n=1 Tax=Sphingobacterium zhuxiongii TaxID=2662364 RepID=A0A5Q0Q978_9SPHI|nr:MULTISPECIES: hypothetical protein [unclassified Sphingobacterium]MVZ66945.1 hypothetical protein [Sphingobacterium sp. DK4209]QGA26637.1 hypothetical protein GFH32_09995 [Sphingobacterium sp. dk4302]
MRVLAELPHKDCKITIFGMNQKYIIKFEQGTLEQSYKLAEADVVGGVNGIFEMLDEDFIQNVVALFADMRKAIITTYDKYQ